MKFRVYFNNHERQVYTIDEIMHGALYLFCESNGSNVVKWEQYAGRVFKTHEDVFEGDKVLVQASNKKKQYETEVIKNDQGTITLKENRTIFNHHACIACVLKIIE